MGTQSAVVPEQVLSDLRELDARTGGEGGARRVAWTTTWERARAQFTERAVGLGLTPERDRAGISGLNFAVILIRCSSSFPSRFCARRWAGSTVRSVYGQALPSSKGFSAIAGDRRGASL